jgi:cysteine-rich repeat protein
MINKTTRTICPVTTVALALTLALAACGDDGYSIDQQDAEPEPDAQLFECGNNFLEPGEQCDDGNRINNDGCSSDCMYESVCGDGVRGDPEECDGTDGLPTCVQLGELDGTTSCDASCNIVADCTDEADDLVAWYKLDGTSGVVVDHTNSGNGCTVQGGVERGMPGFIDDAYLFDGVDGYANCGEGVQMDGMDGLTLEAWVNMTAFSGEGMFISRATSLDASNLSYFLGIAGSSSWGFNQYHFMFAASDPGSIAFTGSPIPTGEWHHVAGVYEAGTLTIYLDGEQSGSASQADNGPVQAPAAARTYIGSINDSGGQSTWSTFHQGYLDDIKVWKVARSDEQICADAGGNPDGQGGCTIPDL